MGRRTGAGIVGTPGHPAQAPRPLQLGAIHEMDVKKNPLEAGRESVAGIREGELQLHSIDGARACLGGVGRTWLYAQIKERAIKVVKLGRRTLIPHSELQRLVAECTAEAANDEGEAQA